MIWDAFIATHMNQPVWKNWLIAFLFFLWVLSATAQYPALMGDMVISFQSDGAPRKLQKIGVWTFDQTHQ